MNLRGFRSTTVTFLLLGASVAILAASATRIQVSAHRELTVAYVDSRQSTPEHQQFRDQILAGFESAIGATCGSDVHVHSIVVKPRDAKAKLNGGEYDAALYVGSDRPLALRRMELVTIAGSLPADRGAQPICLIIGKGDPSLAQQLRAAFSRLLTEPTPSVATPIAVISGAGTNFAAAAP